MIFLQGARNLKLRHWGRGMTRARDGNEMEGKEGDGKGERGGIKTGGRVSLHDLL